MDVTAARVLAESKLAEQLPRRWRHVQAVAVKAERVAVVVPPSDRLTLVASAWLHDIGYAPGVLDTGLHALDGARWLRDHGYDTCVASLVANHSCAKYEADERRLGGDLRAEFPAEPSMLSDALWYADMTTGPDGEDLDVSDRLREVRSRYGPGHPVTRAWTKAEPVILAAVRRVEDRLTALGVQPM
jgi:hypothetical protein